MNRLKRALKKLARKSGSSSETEASGSVASGSAAQLAVPAGSAGASRRSSGSSAGDLAPEARLAARNALFDTYAEAGDEMSFAGVERFFADCDVAIDSFACLALCFRFECKRMGYITRDEFLTGMEALDAATMDHLQDRLADIEASIKGDDDEYAALHRYAYAFSLVEGERNLDIETAAVMLELVLGGEASLVGLFADFIRSQKGYKSINRDQWVSFFHFARAFEAEEAASAGRRPLSPEAFGALDEVERAARYEGGGWATLADHDDTGAWPVLIDAFVEWLVERFVKKDGAL